MANRPPTLPSDAPEQPKARIQPGSDDMHRTEAYIGSFVQVRAQELGITVSDGQLREITAGITGRLTPAQRSGTASINMADVSGMIEADLRRQTEVGKPVNMYSADAARLEAQNGGGRWGANAALFAGSSMRGRDGGTDSSSGEAASSRRFDGINGLAGLTPSEKLTHSYAIQQGVTWAADNRDILKLGPAAIDVLKQTQLRKDVYEGLTKEAGLSAKGTIGIAKMAHDRGEDANEAGTEIKDSLKTMNDKAVTKAVDDCGKLQMDPKATPEQKEAAKKEVGSRVEEHVKTHHEHAKEGEKLKKRMGIEKKNTEAKNEHNNQASATAAKSEQKDATAKGNDDLLASLNSDKPKPEQAKQDKPRVTQSSAPKPT